MPHSGPFLSANLPTDRKSTRLNSSHVRISYAVFCLNHTSTTQIYTLSLHDALPILSFKSDAAIRRVCKNLAEHGRIGHLTSAEGGIKTHLADGSRVTVFRPNNASQWAFFVRKFANRSEEHTSELQSRPHLVCRLLLESYVYHPDLHSFPTRRSSDLIL